MSKKLETGKLGEYIASEFLSKLGYTILEKNWRFKKAEIDIIARDRDVLVFVEVKSRSYSHFGAPEENITTYKENLIVDAAAQYMISVGHEWEIRFDIISIVFSKNGNPELHHYKDAFFPSL